MSVLKPNAICLAVVVALALPLLGCEDNSKPDLKDAKERVKKMQSFVDIYKAVNGDYSKLSPEQKENLLQIYNGSEMKAKAGFIGASDGPVAAQRYLAEARARGEK